MAALQTQTRTLMLTRQICSRDNFQAKAIEAVSKVQRERDSFLLMARKTLVLTDSLSRARL